MQLLFFFLFSFFSQAYALDTGTGADGVCNFNGGAETGTLFNCTELNVAPLSVTTFTGTSNIIIKVQGDVNIQGELDVSSTGILGRAGGFAGGNGGATANGDSGDYPSSFINARGNGGQGSGISPADECSGGSASGGRHSSIDIPGNGDNATNIGPLLCNNPAVGGAAPTQSYGSATSLHQNIFGGSGGGGGGAGYNGVGSVQGGFGGAGGGVLKIISGGDVTLNGATLKANGAPGNPGTAISAGIASGAGGGGAGGAILISALGNLQIISASTLEALGGAGGTNPNGVNGSAGGRGIIRLEDDSGQIDTAQLTSNPPVSTGQNPVAAAQSSGSSQTLLTNSDISAGCAVREMDDLNPLAGILFFFFFILGGLLTRWAKIQEASSTWSFKG